VAGLVVPIPTFPETVSTYSWLVFTARLPTIVVVARVVAPVTLRVEDSVVAPVTARVDDSGSGYG